jgi:membrane fusion protein (multidrug efflux system)
LDLEYCTIRAAVDGVVTRKTVQLGQTVQPGQALMALVPLENIWAVANFKENQLHNMRVGQSVTIHVDTFNKDFNGRVQSIGAASAAITSLLPPENATGNFVKVVQRIPVKITFDQGQDPNHLLRPGMSVEPTVLTK